MSRAWVTAIEIAQEKRSRRSAWEHQETPRASTGDEANVDEGRHNIGIAAKEDASVLLWQGQLLNMERLLDLPLAHHYCIECDARGLQT